MLTFNGGFIAIVTVMALVIPTAGAQAQTYTLFDVPPPPGATALTISDVNGSAMAIGVAGNDRFSAPFLFDGFSSSWLPVIENARTFVINNRGIVAGVRVRSGPRGDTRLFFTFDAIRGDDYDEVALPDDASTEIVRFTDSGIALLQSSIQRRSYAIFDSQVYDLSVFGLVTDIADDGTIAGNGPDNTPFVRRLDGGMRFPFAEPAGGLRLGGEFVAAVSGDLSGPNASLTLLSAGPDEVVKRAAGFHGLSRILDMNDRGEAVGVAVNGMRTPQFDAFRFRDGVVLPLDFQDLGEPRYLREAFAISDNGIVGVLANRPVGSKRIYSLLIPTGVPDRPRAPSFNVSGNLITLSWSGSLGALEYLVEAGSASGLYDVYNAAVGQVLGLAGTIPSGRYFVRLRARNAVGVSAASNEVVIDVR
jgi:hypothetical protein